MDANIEQQPSQQPAGQQPYIGEEALRPLARMIARRLLAERKCPVGVSGNAQPGALPEAPKESPADLTRDKEGNQ